MAEPTSMNIELTTEASGKIFSLDAATKDYKKFLKEKAKEEKALLKQIDAATKKLNKATSEAERSAAIQQLDELQEKRKQYIKDNAAEESRLARASEDSLNKTKQKNLEENSKKFKENLESVLDSSSIYSKLTNLTSTLDSTMASFLTTLESIAYNLVGTGASFEDVNDTLTNALAGTGIVKLEAVYANLKTLLENGIVYDAEQRAYLMTLTEDLGNAFNMQSQSLNRLIALQRNDLSDNRLAIQASLKEFLNQNYQTSQYIKEGFTSVSEALIEAQSTMSAADASAFEATIQTWLGSLSSVGATTETINNLASALNKLGSGDVSGLASDNMMALIAMGANQAGLSYGNLITEDTDVAQILKLLQGISETVNELIGGGANKAVQSELAKAFGISVSDIKAFSNYSSITTTGTVTDDIGAALLDDADDFIYTTTQIENALQNFIYQWGANIAADETYYSIYRAVEIASDIAAVALDGINVSILGVSTDLGKVAKLVPILTALPALVETGIDSLGNIFGGSTGAASIYEALGGENSKLSSLSVGNITGYDRGTSTSSSVVVTNNSSTDVGKTALTSATSTAGDVVGTDTETYDTTSIYEQIRDDVIPAIENIEVRVDLTDVISTINSKDSVMKEFKSLLTDIKNNTSTKDYTSSGTVTSSGGQTYSTASSVQVSGTTTNYIQDALTASALNLQNIFNLLTSWYTSNKSYTTYSTSSWTEGINTTSNPLTQYMSLGGKMIGIQK